MRTNTNSSLVRILALGSAITTLFLSGCGGGGDSGSTFQEGQVSGLKASLVGFNDPSGTLLTGGQAPGYDGILTLPGSPSAQADYSRVAIHVTYHSPVPSNEIVEYHVFRPDFEGGDVVGLPLSTDVPKPLPVFTQEGSSDLDFWDDGSDRALSYTTIDQASHTPLVISSGNAVVLGTGLKVSLAGKRFTYLVETLIKRGNTYSLTKKVAANTVTYLQPASLVLSSFSGVQGNRVFLSLPSTLGANDYILELSSQASFTIKKTIKPYDPSLIQASSAIQSNPRHGANFPYFDPNTGFDMTGAFPGASIVYARIGVRDSANGQSMVSNPYLYSDTVQVQPALFR